MKIENLIKTRRSIRKYERIPISKKQIVRILEAGRWAPSAHNSQPWRFIVVQNNYIIKKLSELLTKESSYLLAGFNIILKETAKVVVNAPLVIVVYNSCELSKRMKKFGEPYFSITKVSEVQSIAGAIQNMLLTARSLNIGSAWLTAPLFCEKKVKRIFCIEGSLVAIITFGYSKTLNFKSRRRSVTELTRFI